MPELTVKLNWLMSTAILFVIVVPANFLVVKVWNMIKSKTSIPLLLSTITICNTLYTTLDDVYHTINHTDFIDNTGECVTNHIIGPMFMPAHSVSMLVTTIIYIQRWAVCVFPVKGSKVFGYKTSAISLYSLGAVVVVIAW